MSAMRNSLITVLYSLLHAFIFDAGQAFPDGAPTDTCWTMYPKHSGIIAKETPSPFSISVSPSLYKPGEHITLTIADPAGRRNFRGLQVGAHRQTGNTEEIVGQFTGFPGNKVQVFTCFGGYKNMVTHKNSQAMDSVSLTWRAPAENVGNISFIATIVEDYTTFWLHVEAELYAANPDPSLIARSVYPPPYLTTLVSDIDFSACGDTKSCFLYPRLCEGSSCMAAVAFQYRVQTDDLLVEMSTDVAENYISVAFSEDQYMGSDETYTCVSQGGLMSIQHGYNPEYYNDRLLTTGISEMELRHANGRLECKFVIPRTGIVNQVVQDSNPLSYNNISYDLQMLWYVQMAWGKTMPDTDVLTKHRDMPVQTDSMIDVRDNSVHRGGAYPSLVRAHMTLNTFAWVFLAGIVTVISRHYKDLKPNVLICGTRLWFQLHRGLAVLIAILTVVALIVIFAQYGSGIRESSTPHSYVGLALIVALGLQILAGFLRPGHDHPFRVLFNWGHWFMGHLAHLLAVVTIYLGFEIRYVNKEQRRNEFIAISVWVVLQVLWHIAFEIIRCRKLSDKEPETQPINAPDKEQDVDKSKKAERHAVLEILLLVVYIITLAAVMSSIFVSGLNY